MSDYNNSLLESDEQFQAKMTALHQKINEHQIKMKHLDEENKKSEKITRIFSSIFWIIVIVAMIKHWIL